jgi:hypothetical protein
MKERSEIKEKKTSQCCTKEVANILQFKDIRQ